MKGLGPLPSSSWLVTLLLLAVTVSTVTSGRGKKGDSCSRDPDCDQNSFIGCNKQTRTCDCPQRENVHLFYNLNGKCVSYVDGVCTYVKTQNLPSMNCVDNAVCVKLRGPTEVDGKCVCKTGYYRTRGNQCAKNLPLPTTNSVFGGGGGLEVPGSPTKLPSTRHEPYSYPSSASAKGLSVKIFLVTLFLKLSILKSYDII